MRRLTEKRLLAMHRNQRGFTLVEMVIVAALIALFSSLAVFGVQQQFRSNLRKAAIGEARQIATALDFANLDTALFPRLCWLTESRESLDLLATQIVPGQELRLYANLDINSRATDLLPANSLREAWNGPYFAQSQSRAGVAQGRGGFCYMLIPDGTVPAGLPAVGPNNPTDAAFPGLRWPLDPYNNPYVVYMLDVDFTVNPPNVRFVNADPVTGRNPRIRKGNFANAVVSYGPNQYPGGDDEFDKAPYTGTGFATDGGGIWARRLYKGRPGFTARGSITHTALTDAEYQGAEGLNRARAWSRQFDAAIGVGIADPGSDDIVFEF